MSATAEAPLSKGGHSKTKRSFISRLPSFRKKKSPPVPESELDMHLRSAEEDLNGSVIVRPPGQVKNRKEDEVRRKSKTSSIVASYEKRLSDLKDEETRTNGKKTKGGKSTSVGSSSKTQPDGAPTAYKTSRFGFGFAWQKITSFENGTTNGRKTDSSNGRSKGDEVNANVEQDGSTGSRVKGHSLDLHLPHGSPPDRESSSSVRTPDSDRSSVSSNSSAKVYGQPMPYRSVFSDEPRGIKRQASSSQSDGLNSSGISMSTSTSPLHDDSSRKTGTHRDSSENGLQMNSTFTKDNGAASINPGILNKTFPIEDSPTCIVNRTFKLEPAEDYGRANTTATVKQELFEEAPELVEKENPISCSNVKPSSSTAAEKDCHDIAGQSGTQSEALDEVTVPRQDVSRPIASPARNIPTEISAVHTCIKNSRPETFLSPRHRLTCDTMGGIQSVMDGYSTPTRPIELSLQLRNPHINAIKNYSESLDSCELDSLCSEDLMCDSRYLDDDMFDSRDESSCLLSRSLSTEETAAMYRSHHGCAMTGRARAVSVDQVQLPSSNHSLDKRVGVTRGLSPSPLALPPGRRGGRHYPAHPVPDEHCQSPVEELQSLISSSSYRDVDRNKNGNANCSRVRSHSGGNSHPLRPPRWPNLPLDEDGAVLLDASVYRHMIQDMTSVKTMLFKLKRALQTVDNSSSPFEHSQGLISPCSSLPTSPMTEANPIQEVIMDDLREENAVLRKEVRNLQELLADTQHQLKGLRIQQAQRAGPEQLHASTQCTSEVRYTSETRDQSLQVNLPPYSFPSKALSSSPTHRKYRAEVSKIKAAYEEYIRLHNVKGDEQPKKLSNMTPSQGSPLKVGRSPTSPEPPPSELTNHMEASPPESRRRPQRSPTPPSGHSSPERAKSSKAPKSKSSILTSPAKPKAVVAPHILATPQISDGGTHSASACQVSQNAPASPSHKEVTPEAAAIQNQKVGGPRKQTSRSKLVQPVSYKSKLAGSQDSLLSDGSQPDDGREPADDRRGGPLKRQLPQAPRGTGIPQKSQPGGRQAAMDLQQKSMLELNGSTEGIPKPKEIRMMPGRQQTGKSTGLLPRGPLGQAQSDSPSQINQGEKENGLPLKMPSLLSTTKSTKQEPLTSRGVADRQPLLTDANSNPVSQQNGIPMKASGVQQPQFVRRAEQPTVVDVRPKAGPVPVGQFVRRKQSPPGPARPYYQSQSPERGASDEERATPPPSPQARGQQPRSSRIAVPVRGRGASKLPRGSGIPTRRTNNT